MANSYSDWPVRDGEHFTLANRNTDHLILPWHATASELATTPIQQRLAAWLGERSQVRGGLGCVGFGIEDIHWTPSGWQVQRDFLVRTVARLERRESSWPSAFTRYRLPTETMEPTIIRVSRQLQAWLLSWDDAKLERSRNETRLAAGASWCPSRPYPQAWDGLAWDDIPIGLCPEHGMWCPTPEGLVPECVFCDETPRGSA